MPVPRRNFRAEARAAAKAAGPGPTGRRREMPLCGHTDTWSWDDASPLVCSLCHPKPGTSPPRPPAVPAGPFVTARLSPSPWAAELREKVEW